MIGFFIWFMLWTGLFIWLIRRVKNLRNATKIQKLFFGMVILTLYLSSLAFGPVIGTIVFVGFVVLAFLILLIGGFLGKLIMKAWEFVME